MCFSKVSLKKTSEGNFGLTFEIHEHLSSLPFVSLVTRIRVSFNLENNYLYILILENHKEKIQNRNERK